MRDERRARINPTRTGLFVACLVCVGALLGGTPPGHMLLLLQMNLCDSGIADCYTGRSVAEAATVIRATGPDVVTLNEICQSDVTALAGGFGAAVFRAAGDRRTGGPYRCRNGEPYGIGVLVRNPGPGYTTFSGLYPTQDLRDPEERAWVCVDGGLRLCATHLASTSADIARAQCGYLVAAVARRSTVVGGDFNLGNLRSCTPAGFLHRSDGAVQQVVATAGFMLDSGRSIPMDGTTDHPGLLVTLTAPA
jgi:endonuclease/exonuclease/phosphatase family metal-dependent hydrolase